MRRVWCGMAVAALALAAGCVSRGPALPVSGIVTLDGKPLDGAAVTFFPDAGTDGTGGTGQTGTDGKFVITGAKGANGLPPGRYKVTVSKLAMAGGVTDEPVLAAVTEADIKKDLPPIYSDPSQTVLSYAVTGDGKPIEIQLDSKRKK